MRQLKLIWDFKGPDGNKIAEHHVLHLKAYITAENLEINITGIETINDLHTVAYMVVVESEMPKVRDALKPHRGQVYNLP
ncbi:hypothetical protein [Seonamhaeicola sp.]|uniref:hypothetical protein n=1 Tax=Seonamhaeicola sp. TaxID=1912245 RepID=UPI002623A346|nr:hypothetical protein [Seonamhaeicola sp.]